MPPSRAIAELAEKTITRPKNISSTTMVKSTLSNASFLAMRGSPVGLAGEEIADQLLEDIAAVVEVPELVEAGAGGRQHDGVARPRRRRRRSQGAVESLRALDGHGAVEGRRELAGRLADQIGAA